MKYFFATILCLFNLAYLRAQNQNADAQPLSIGQIRTIKSEVLNEERTLNIYLPGKYDTAKAYPVIYLLDGSMDEDFIHIAGLVQFFNLMFNMPETIVVGIANVDRKRDFTFKTELKELTKKYPTTGHSDAFIHFIETELQPFVQQHYKTNGTRYLIGQSLGGLLASEILLKKPHLFTHYLIVSPSLWWDNESLLQQAETLLARQPDLDRYVYISVGKQEDEIMRRVAKALFETLGRADKKSLKLDYKLMEDDNHATILHGSIYQALLKLFPYKE
ncbi:MAG: alpha/beta hydrolase [Lewinellaceae bacterium]|nr:alpha/beta hydrolase [Lewinellaceae bacterium]